MKKPKQDTKVAKTLNWELFYEKRPSVIEVLVCELYAKLTSSKLTKVPVHGIKILTGKTIDVGKIIIRGIQNCAVRRSGPIYFPFTITILCLKAKILANVKKTGYIQGTITDWDLYRIAGDSVLQQRVKESEDPEEEEEEEYPTEVELVQSAEVSDKVEPKESEAETDVETSMFRAQPLCPNLQDELSKLMDIMQHMQWQQHAY
ncbi:hypothetical protein PVK06_040002 [Gossypium arboreum]|uniref:Uncharacterized protein n=1 Tax=Gossypium arboreum TaxID=29729 RepID=A0ABR0N4B1_GOSAR|nr:hypothetical protein PVK06_040002 [Gossypium arboreum]